MIAISEPLICPSCEKKMMTYRILPHNKKLLFICTCGKSLEVTEHEYLKRMRKQ